MNVICKGENFSLDVGENNRIFPYKFFQGTNVFLLEDCHSKQS